jgi:hypothetical protein
MAKLVDRTGIAEQVDAWYWEDQGGKKPGGAARIVSTRTLLILFLVLTVEHSAQLVDDMAKMVATRLSNQSLQFLDLWGQPKRKKKKHWYFPLYRATERFVDTIDPKPAKGKKRKFPTLAEIEEIFRKRETGGTSKKQVRLEWVANGLIDATVKEIPEEILATWYGDTAIDATVVPVYAKRGAPWTRKEANDLSRRSALEFDAGWYLRTGRHEVTDNHKEAKKSVFGYDASVVTMTANDPNSVPLHPLLVLGIGLTIPSTEISETATKVYTDIAERGYPVGRASGDRAYGAGSKAEKYQIPMRQLGYELYGDYKDDQLGKVGGHYAGAIMVEGGFYCPSMPENLAEATVNYRAKTINQQEYRQLIERRRLYKLRPKEKPDAQGRVPMMCPARGPGATVDCPIARACGGNLPKPTDDLVPIYNPPTGEKKDLLPICGNKSSVSFPIEAGAKLFQTGHFGSEEWQDIYSNDRNTIEGKNAYLKDGAREGIEIASRRRLRGYAAQYFLIALLYAAGNLRALERYRDEFVEPETDEQLEHFFETKLARKMDRKANAPSRIGKWDDFSDRNNLDDKVEPPPDRT